MIVPMNKSLTLENRVCVKGCGSFRARKNQTECPACGAESSQQPAPSSPAGGPPETKDDGLLS
jgi:ribosomal protein S27AE